MSLALECAMAPLLALTFTTWFGAWPRGVHAAIPLLLLLAAAAARVRMSGTPRLPRPSLDTLAVLGAALAFRLPALLHPWAWVNRDGAYGAFVALHLLQGSRPAPVFTEGANYQGTLKGHLAALLSLLTGAQDLSLLMTAAGLVLFLVFVAATMALARRVGGRWAALAAGAYLAFGPKFLTVLSLNSVGQYVDVLALGGLALALLGRVLDDDAAGAPARAAYAGVGLLLGLAFWQQPVALCYVVAAAAALAFRRTTWRDPWTLLVPAGFVLGVLPVVIWNVQNDWATQDIVARDGDELAAQLDALPVLVRRAFRISFPILAGLSPGHPWGSGPGLRTAAAALIPVAFGAYLARNWRELTAGLRRARPSPAILAPLLLLACLAIFWSVAQGRVYWRPRYVLPVMAATAVHLGVAVAWLGGRSRLLAAAVFGAVLCLNVAGTWPRLRESAGAADHYRRLVRAVEEKGIRTGYADFSIAAPVTMFTRERVVFSSRLGPTPAYESPAHTRRVEAEGPDAYVLLPDDDPARFAATLRALGVTFLETSEPLPMFWSFSRRVRLEEIAGFRGGRRAPARAIEE